MAQLSYHNPLASSMTVRADLRLTQFPHQIFVVSLSEDELTHL